MPGIKDYENLVATLPTVDGIFVWNNGSWSIDCGCSLNDDEKKDCYAYIEGRIDSDDWEEISDHISDELEKAELEEAEQED